MSILNQFKVVSCCCVLNVKFYLNNAKIRYHQLTQIFSLMYDTSYYNIIIQTFCLDWQYFSFVTNLLFNKQATANISPSSSPRKPVLLIVVITSPVRTCLHSVTGNLSRFIYWIIYITDHNFFLVFNEIHFLSIY